MEPAKNKVVIAPHKPQNAVNRLVVVGPGDNPVYSGEVEAVGADVTAVEPGHTVVFGRFAGVEVDEKIVMGEDEILAVIED